MSDSTAGSGWLKETEDWLERVWSSFDDQHLVWLHLILLEHPQEGIARRLIAEAERRDWPEGWYEDPSVIPSLAAGDPSELAAAGKWDEAFNALPLWIRRIGAAQECQTRIQHLAFEKDRVIKRKDQSLGEIADHRKNCEQGLRRLQREASSA